MSKSKVLAMVAAALVAGLVLGGVGISSAATGSTAPAQGYGLRLGASFREAKATMADVVARLTGKPVDEVYDARQDGKSLAEIAKAAGVSSDKVVGEALKARTSILDERVKAGQITEAEKAAILDRMESRMKTRIEDPTACQGGGNGAGGGRGGRGGGMGRGAGGCGGCATATQ